MNIVENLNWIDKKKKILLGLWLAFIIGIGVINETYILTILYIVAFCILTLIIKPKSVYDTAYELMMISMIFDYTLYFPAISKIYVFHIALGIFSLITLIKLIKNIDIIKKLDKNIIIILGIFFAFIVISFTWAISKSMAIQFILIYLMMIVFILDMLIYNINKEGFNKTIKIVISLFAFIVVVGAVETITGTQLPVVHNYTTADYSPIQMAVCNSMPIAFSYNLNNYACMLAIIAPFLLFAIYKTNSTIAKILIAFVATFSFAIAVITTSRTGFVAMVVVFGSFFLFSLINVKKLKKLNIIIMVFMAIGVVVLYKYAYLIPNIKPIYGDNGLEIKYDKTNALNDKMGKLESQEVEFQGEGSINVRWTIAKDILTGVFVDKNLVGFGVGNSQEYIRLLDNTGGTYRTHSLVLELLGDFGVVGLLLYGVMYLYLLIRNSILAVKRRDNISIAVLVGLIALIPASFGPSTITYIFLYWVLLALASSNIQVNLNKVV